MRNNRPEPIGAILFGGGMKLTVLKIRDPSLNLLAFIEEYDRDEIHEAINREFTFSFTAIIDGEKSDYLVEDNIVEVAGNYFVILYSAAKRNQDDTLTIDVDCDQVAMTLNDPEYNVEYFAADGPPAAVIAEILAGTPFTVGDVDPTEVVTFSIQEAATRRGVLIQFAEYLGAELKFEKYTISLLNRRGSDSGVEFRYRKNLRGITRHRDKRSGTLQVAYDVDVLELRTLPEYGELEAYELGDTVTVIDEGLGVSEQLRIVEYDYSPRLRINSKVQIADYVDGIEDTVTRIQRTTVVKDRQYNGIRIGPEYGFRSTFSDNSSRATLNAQEISIEVSEDIGETWTPVFYVEVEEGIPKLFLAGDAIFEGELRAATGSFTGEITANSGNIGGWIISESGLISASGSYPRIDLLASENLFAVYTTSSDYISISPLGVSNRPELSFHEGASKGTITFAFGTFSINSNDRTYLGGVTVDFEASNGITFFPGSGKVNFPSLSSIYLTTEGQTLQEIIDAL